MQFILQSALGGDRYLVKLADMNNLSLVFRCQSFLCKLENAPTCESDVGQLKSGLFV